MSQLPVSGGQRVLHVVTRDQRRGAEAAAVDLARELGALGHVTRVVALAPSAAGDPLGVEVLGPHTLGWTTLRRLRQCATDADVVIGHGSRTLPAMVMATLGHRGLRRIYQSIGDPAFWAARPTRRWRVRALAHRMAALAVLTERSRTAWAEIISVPRGKLVVIPNWRDSRHFTPASEVQRQAAREHLGCAPDGPVVVAIGALSPEKGLDLVLESLAMLPGVELLVAGDGPERERLVTRAGELAPGRVRFLGSVTDVRVVLHASDVLVMTSTSEGLPGVLLEAGMCGLPSVATRVGFVDEVVIHNKTGCLLEGRDPGAFAGAVQRALSHQEAWGAAARRNCVERFDTAHVLHQWDRLLTTSATEPDR